MNKKTKDSIIVVCSILDTVCNIITMIALLA